MHRDQSVRTKLEKGLHCFLWIHVDLASRRRVVAPNRQQRDLDVVTFADLPESIEVGAVAAVKDVAPIHLQNKAAKAAVEIGQKSGAPVRTRSQRYVDRTQLHRLPVIELVHDIETKIVHQIADADGHDDRLIGRHLGQSAPVEMVEMRVRDENEIDRGQMMDLEARSLEALDYLEPFRPD